MSHWAKIETQFTYQEELIASLEDIFGKGSVEVGKTTITTFGQEERVDFVVRRQHTKSYDLGFVYENGVYKMVRESMMRFDLQNLVSNYAERVIKNRLPRGKYRVLEREKDRIKIQQRI